MNKTQTVTEFLKMVLSVRVKETYEKQVHPILSITIIISEAIEKV